MSEVVISAEYVSKKYNLGTISSGTLFRDLNMYWAKIRGKSNPYAKMNESGTFTEGEHWALNDVSFDIKQGDAVGIIGKNGAGKSTLLKILSRVTTPTSGNIKIKGRIASLLEVGTGFHPEMTGRENIFLNGAILGMSQVEIRKKLDEIVAFAGIEKYIDTPVKRYSSGMYVRLAFGVAAHLEPEILIVDEVLAVGDAEFQKKCLGKMNDVSKNEGRTVLFVSHNMGAVNQLCNQAIVLNKGEVYYTGDTQSAIKKYFHSLQKNAIQKRDIIGPLAELINSIKITLNSSESQSQIISVKDELAFEIHYNVDANIESLRLYISVMNQGNGVLTIHDRTVPTYTSKGTYCSIFKIPAYTLRPGEYTIILGGHDNAYNNLGSGTSWFFVNEVFLFDVKEEWDLDMDFNNRGAINIKHQATFIKLTSNL